MRKSVEGLSIFLFFFAFCGNLTYVASILLNPAGSASPSDAGHYSPPPSHTRRSYRSSMPSPLSHSSPWHLSPSSNHSEIGEIADNQIPTRIRRYPLIRHDNNDPIIHVRFRPPTPRCTRINNPSEKQAEENNNRRRIYSFKWRRTYTYKWGKRGETTFITAHGEA
jgi:hypothetical protein